MPVFQYTARTLKGDLVNDKIDLPTRDDVIAHLRKIRMVVVQVRAAPKEFKLNIKFGGGVKTRDVVVFTRQFATMINAGLPLVQALDILAQQIENNDAIVRKVKGAMIYPCVILSVAVIAISVLLIFVIPTFQNMFASVNLQLPLPTRMVIGASNVLKEYWWAIIGAIGAGVFALNRYYQTAPGRLQIDTMLLKTPARSGN